MADRIAAATLASLAGTALDPSVPVDRFEGTRLLPGQRPPVAEPYPVPVSPAAATAAATYVVSPAIEASAAPAPEYGEVFLTSRLPLVATAPARTRMSLDLVADLAHGVVNGNEVTIGTTRDGQLISYRVTGWSTYPPALELERVWRHGDRVHVAGRPEVWTFAGTRVPGGEVHSDGTLVALLTRREGDVEIGTNARTDQLQPAGAW